MKNTLILLLVLAFPVLSADTPPAQPTLDQLVAQLTKTRADRADAEKARAAAEAAMAALRKAESDQIAQINKFIEDLRAKLGIVDVPPPPADVYLQDLQAAFDKEDQASKAKLSLLILFYSGPAQDNTDDKDITNTFDLLKVLRASRMSSISETELSKVRAVVDVKLVPIMGKESQPLTEPLRKALIAQFMLAADKLKGIKK